MNYNPNIQLTADAKFHVIALDIVVSNNKTIRSIKYIAGILNPEYFAITQTVKITDINNIDNPRISLCKAISDSRDSLLIPFILFAAFAKNNTFLAKLSFKTTKPLLDFSTVETFVDMIPDCLSELSNAAQSVEIDDVGTFEKLTLFPEGLNHRNNIALARLA